MSQIAILEGYRVPRRRRHRRRRSFRDLGRVHRRRRGGRRGQRGKFAKAARACSVQVRRRGGSFRACMKRKLKGR